MPIKIQTLPHIHKNSLLLLPTPTKVAFNVTVLVPILQDSVFSWICLSRKLLRLLIVTRCGILTGELLYRIAAISGLNCIPLWLPFL